MNHTKQSSPLVAAPPPNPLRNGGGRGRCSVDDFLDCGSAGAPVRQAFVMDSHCHLGPLGRMRILDSSTPGLVRAMNRLGVDVAAATPCPACIDGQIALGNDIAIDAVRRYPDRIFGYMSVNPLYPREVEVELARCLAAGLRGIKVHSSLGPAYNHPDYAMVWEFADEHGLPVLAHTGGDEIAQLEELFTRYPGIHWILAHGGISDPPLYVRVGTTYPNVYVDTTFSRCPRGLIEWFVQSGLEDKLLWGTDAAFLNGAGQLGRVLFAKISPEQKEKILGANARRAFGLTKGPR